MMRSHDARTRNFILGAAAAVGVVWAAMAIACKRTVLLETFKPEDVAEPGTQVINIDGKPVAYRVAGHGERTVILLHGFSSSLATWDSLQQPLSKTYRTVAIDLWGFGASARPATLSPHDWVRQVFSFMDALHIDRAAFVGHSLGGWISLMCAAERPDRVERLAIIDGGGLQQPRAFPLLLGIANYPVLALSLRHFRRSARGMARSLRMSYGPDVQITEELIQRYQRPLLVEGTEKCWNHLGKTYHGVSYSRVTPRVTCPVLLIWGGDDHISPVSYGVTLMKELTHAALVVIPHVSHLPHEICPEAVAAYLAPFLHDASIHHRKCA